MGEVKASDPATTPVEAGSNGAGPASAISMCETSDVHGQRGETTVFPRSSVETVPSPSSSSLPVVGSQDSLSVVTQQDYSVSGGDTDRRTNHHVASEPISSAGESDSAEPVLATTGPVLAQSPIAAQERETIAVNTNVTPLATPTAAAEYPPAWISGVTPHTSVMEPVAINPETGFTTVLVDATAVNMASYPHAPPAQWPGPGGYSLPSPHLHTHPHSHPPPHFHLHPHTYVPGEITPADYGFMTSGYEPVHAPHYESVGPAMYHDPNMHQHLSAANTAHVYGSSGVAPGIVSGQKGVNGRTPNRILRGSSVSPKRPNNRSSSQSNNMPPSQPHQRPANASAGSGGRYTPSPSSGGGSRGSSPGQTSLQAPCPAPPAATTTPVATPALSHCPTASTCIAGPPNGSPLTTGQHVVHLHVNPGETVSLQMGGQVQVIQGPATVRMVSTGSPPVPLPVQVPPGHVLQQIVDERGTLRHVILSPAPAPAQPTSTTPSTASLPNGPMTSLPMATPHPPPQPPHLHGSSHNHNVGQPPPTQHFYGPSHQGGYIGPQGGYPAQFGGPPLQSSLINHTPLPHGQPPNFSMSQASGQVIDPSPPSAPTAIFQNERAQRQFAKLRKKLENRSKANAASNCTTPSPNSPPISPKKDNNNVQKLKDRNQGEVTVSASGVIGNALECRDSGSAEVKPPLLESIARLIGELELPQVQEIEARKVTITWKPVGTVIRPVSEPESLSEQVDISYEVSVGEKAKETKVTHSFAGKECTFSVSNLKPGCDYWVRLSALINQVKVREAVTAEFRTAAHRPDAPLPPKVQNRTRNSLVLRWVAPADNGSHISYYVLECDDGTDSCKFTEVYRGRNKQFSISKLQASTNYAIRLAASNDLGTSEWSPVLNVVTMGAPPIAPAPPILLKASATTLVLSWAKATAPDQVYTLQLSDSISGHGFLNVYHGPENEYTCCGLYRNTSYLFRLQVQSDCGVSRWSEEISFSTTVEPPSVPTRLAVKGRVHAHSFRVRWEPPTDTGGSQITDYHLELDDGHDFLLTWNGSEMEFLCDRLKPGTSYRVRIACSNSGGRSNFSEPCLVTTEPVCPSPCPAPLVVGKARSSSLLLKWDNPDFDGGSMVIQYEVSLTNPDGSSRIAYAGRETECLVASLLPGRSYSFRVRAANRIGFGPWSDSLETLSGPGVPDVPEQLQLVNRTSHSILVSWNEPSHNGSPVNEYRLETAQNSTVKRSSSAGSLSLATPSGMVDDQTEEVDPDQLQFTQLSICGSARCHEVKGLQPMTLYHLRIQAVNNVGNSGFSSVVSFTTLAAPPTAVSGLHCIQANTTSLSVSWSTPNANGSAISHYNLEVGEKLSLTTTSIETTFHINGLSPNTLYRIRVQAVNAIGIGSFSPTLKCSTQPLPPAPPSLECILVSHNHLKLRWGDGRNLDFIHYSVEMQEEDGKEFYLVYEGTSQSYKVPKLKELTTYKFRICARNDVGEGPYSQVKEFTTTRAPPPTLKKPDILDLNETSCRVYWSAYRMLVPSDRVAFQVELIRVKDQEQVLMERCHANELFVSGLEPRTEYSVRACPVRLCNDGEIAGSYSPTRLFSTPLGQDLTPMAMNKHASPQATENIRDPLTDKHWTLIGIAAFTAVSILVAVLKQLLSP